MGIIKRYSCNISKKALLKCTVFGFFFVSLIPQTEARRKGWPCFKMS